MTSNECAFWVYVLPDSIFCDDRLNAKHKYFEFCIFYTKQVSDWYQSDTYLIAIGHKSIAIGHMF